MAEITVCPECGSCEIRRRSARCLETNAAGARYHCADCEAGFDEPDTRPRKTESNPTPGTAARALVEADPEVIGEGAVLACPACDESGIRRTGADTARGTTHDGVWHCEACGERFTSPLRRPPRDATGSSRNGLARTLETTDADDLIPDGGSDVAATAHEPTEVKLPINDRFHERVRDDHAPNQMLHDVLREVKTIDNTDLMGSHAPGEKPYDPTYHVWTEFRNEGVGHPIVHDPVATLVERGDVKLCDVVECSDNQLIVALRPVETRVEPVTIRPHEVPDRLIEAAIGGDDATDDNDPVPDGGDLPAACPVCEADIDGDADRPYQCDCGHLFYELSMDGGTRECHACGAETEGDRCHACFAVPWTDYPVDHDAALIRATRLRDRADRLETRAAGRPGGGDGA